MTQITARIKQRGDLEANWISADPIIGLKEIVLTTDVFYTGTDQPKIKIGDGIQTWTQLDYLPISSSLQWADITNTISGSTYNLSHAYTNGQGFYINGQRVFVGGKIQSIVGLLVTFDDDYTGELFTETGFY